MSKPNTALNLAQALEDVTVDEIINLPEQDTVRLALAFEGFVDKIGQVIAKSQHQKRMN